MLRSKFLTQQRLAVGLAVLIVASLASIIYALPGLALGPSKPTGLTATVFSSSQINLSWDASTFTCYGCVTQYNIYRNGSYLTRVSTNAYYNTGLVASTSYSYTVAVYIEGYYLSNNSSIVYATTLPSSGVEDTQAPSTPATITAITNSTSPQIYLAWNISSDNVGVSGYKIYRNGAYLTSTSNASYSDTGLSAATSYSYTVAAYDAAGNLSAQSGSVSATTHASTISPVPGAGAPEPSTNDEVGVWAQVDVATGQIVGSALCTKSVCGLNGDWHGYVPPATYAAGSVWWPTLKRYIWQLPGQTGYGSGTFNFNTYVFTVQGGTIYNGQFTSTPTSGTVSPSTPIGLLATAVSPSQINLSWNASTDNVEVDGYKIYRNGVLWYQVTKLNYVSSLTAYSDTGLSSNTSYSYYIKAFDAAGNLSLASATVSATTQSGAATCSGLNLTFQGGKSSFVIGETVTYTYTCAPSGAASYVEIQVVKPDGTVTTYNSASGNISANTIGFGTSNLVAGSHILRACFSVGCSSVTVSLPFSIVASTSTPTSTSLPVVATTNPIPSPTPIPTPVPMPALPTGMASTSQIPVVFPFPTPTSLISTSSTPIEQCLQAGGLWCYGDYPASLLGYCAPAKSACERGDQSPRAILLQPPAVNTRVEIQTMEQFLAERRAVLQDLRELERLVKRDIIEIDAKQLKILKEKIFSLKARGGEDIFVLQAYQEQINGLQGNVPTGAEHEFTADPRQEASALKQLKQGLRLLERHIATIEKKIVQIEKSKITVDVAIKETIAIAKDMARKVKGAKSYNDIRDIAEQIPDVGQSLNDVLPHLEELLNLPRILRLVDRRIADGSLAIKQTGAVAKRLKLDVNESLGTMRGLITNAKNTVAAIKSGGATEGLMDTLQEQVFDPLDDIFDLADNIRAVASVRQSVNQATANVKRYEARLRRLKAGSEDRQTASELVGKFKEQLVGLKELSTQKLTPDIGDQIIDRLNVMADLKTELEDVLNLSSPDATQEQIKRLFSAPGEKIKPFQVEQLENGVL